MDRCVVGWSAGRDVDHRVITHVGGRFRYGLLEKSLVGTTLVAPYCAIPRDYLSDTPLLRAMGFLVSQRGQLGAIPPFPLFLRISPVESMQSGGAIPPPHKGYLSDTGAIPYENKGNGCDTPLCDTISKGYCAIWGGISHWAAKGTTVFGTPRFASYCQKSLYFLGSWRKSERPKSSRSYHDPSHPPLDALLRGYAKKHSCSFIVP